jgi:hypothetical protein
MAIANRTRCAWPPESRSPVPQVAQVGEVEDLRQRAAVAVEPAYQVDQLVDTGAGRQAARLEHRRDAAGLDGRARGCAQHPDRAGRGVAQPQHQVDESR